MTSVISGLILAFRHQLGEPEMTTVYKQAKRQIRDLSAIDHELPWLLALDLIVIIAAVGMGMGAIA